MEQTAVRRRRGKIPDFLEPFEIKSVDRDMARAIQRKLKKNGIEMDIGEIEKKLGELSRLRAHGFTEQDMMKFPQLLLYEEEDLERVQPQLDMNQDAGEIYKDMQLLDSLKKSLFELLSQKYLFRGIVLGAQGLVDGEKIRTNGISFTGDADWAMAYALGRRKELGGEAYLVVLKTKNYKLKMRPGEQFPREMVINGPINEDDVVLLRLSKSWSEAYVVYSLKGKHANEGSEEIAKMLVALAKEMFEKRKAEKAKEMESVGV